MYAPAHRQKVRSRFHLRRLQLQCAALREQTKTIEPVLPQVKMNLISVKAPATARVVSNDLCLKGGVKSASFVRHLVVDVTGTPLAGSFLVGQSFGVIPPGEDGRGKPQKVRLFSTACPSWGEDGQGNIVSTTPKRVIDEFKPQKPGDDSQDHALFLGVCSNYLCDQRPGAEVKITGPSGRRFLLPLDTAAHEYLFLATGTGIAPFRGMVLELLENPAGPCRSPIHLIMGSPYTTDLLYDDLFRRLAREHANFHYHTAISREPRPGSDRGIYVHQLIEELIEDFRPLLESPRTLIYICGLLGMQFGVYQVLATHGLGEGYLKRAEPLEGTDPGDWTIDQIKRHVRPTARCMLEVY